MKVKPDGICCLFGAGETFKRLQTLDEEVKRLRREANPDAIHDVRVASRRLRTGFSIFEACLPTGRAKRWRKELRRTTRKLGQARDLDVQIEFVHEFLEKQGQKGDEPGLSRLLVRLTQSRQEAQCEVVKTLARLEKRGVVVGLGQSLARILARGHVSQPKGRSTHLYGQAWSVIRDRLEEMLGFEALVLDHPERKDELHRMRIAAKHLRYTMEIFNPLYDGGLDRSIEAAKAVQKTLGEIHDCDVWMDFLPRFEEDEAVRVREFFGDDESMASLTPGLRRLLADRRRHRARRYKEFAAFWKKKRATWDRLVEILESSGGESRCETCGRSDSGDVRG